MFTGYQNDVSSFKNSAAATQLPSGILFTLLQTRKNSFGYFSRSATIV